MTSNGCCSGPFKFESPEEQRFYEKKVEREIDAFNTACYEAGVFSQPESEWFDIRCKLYDEMVGNRPPSLKVRDIYIYNIYI